MPSIWLLLLLPLAGVIAWSLVKWAKSKPKPFSRRVAYTIVAVGIVWANVLVIAWVNLGWLIWQAV